MGLLSLAHTQLLSRLAFTGLGKLLRSLQTRNEQSSAGLSWVGRSLWFGQICLLSNPHNLVASGLPWTIRNAPLQREPRTKRNPCWPFPMRQPSVTENRREDSVSFWLSCCYTRWSLSHRVAWGFAKSAAQDVVLLSRLNWEPAGLGRFHACVCVYMPLLRRLLIWGWRGWWSSLEWNKSDQRDLLATVRVTVTLHASTQFPETAEQWIAACDAQCKLICSPDCWNRLFRLWRLRSVYFRGSTK